jgi:DNA-binding PadR family transcriptional regulator
VKRGSTKPIAGTEFHALLALSDEPRYGLGIVEEIARRTRGEVRLGPGTLYTAIRRMLEQGLIEELLEAPRGEDDDPRRRYYRITATGRDVLVAEAQRLEQLVRAAHAKRVLGRPA